MATGLAALNKMSRPNPGDDARYPKQNDKDKKPAENEVNRIPAFMPGQKAALASQLNMGFGGGMPQWQNYLNDVYSPLIAEPFVPGVRDPKKDKKDKPDGYTPVRPDGRPQVVIGPTGLVALRGRN